VILPASIGCVDAIDESAKHVFVPGDADDLHRVASAAVASARERVSGAAVRYDTGVLAHVDALLALAKEIRAS
jgi:hypothetical protein